MTSELGIVSCLSVDAAVYAGTEGAHLLRVRKGRPAERVDGFDGVDGRETWFAGSAVIDGRVLGPPLGVRSLAGSRDGRVLLAGVHVGGIPRSVDAGNTWHPTIDIAWDVHEVSIHPENAETAIAACAVGLCVSRDGGATWTLDGPTSGVTHCSAVAFSGEEIFVSVSDGPFASHSTVLRRPLDGSGSLKSVGGGLPDRLEGIVDTGCIASKGAQLGVVDRGGNVYASDDAGRHWSRVTRGIPDASSVLIL
ncbi:MAG: WD40/YVTN/BNR-like repeat-containing protein [Gemmatimonadota bacterium]